jgi:hypothetical protein
MGQNESFSDINARDVVFLSKAAPVSASLAVAYEKTVPSQGP